jgi:hypothetical protein
LIGRAIKFFFRFPPFLCWRVAFGEISASGFQDQHAVQLRREDVVVWVGVCAKEEVTEPAPWQKGQGC